VRSIGRPRTRPFAFAGATVVLTGAAGGIGSALAGALADRGSHLVLLDRDGPGLQALTDRLRAAHPTLSVAVHVVDLADPDATVAVGRRIAAEHPDTTALINNAGVALLGRFDEVTLEEYEWLIDVNFRAVVRLTHTLLPVLAAHPGAHLVNVSSVFGIIAPAGQTAYAAAKFAVRGFTESLRQELAPLGVGVTTVFPGGVRTGITRAARIGSHAVPEALEGTLRRWEVLLSTDPAVVAERILRAVERRRARVLVGATATVPDALVRLLPVGHARLLEPGFALFVALGRRRTRRGPAPEPPGRLRPGR